MNKGKSITLLSLIFVVMACLLAMTFVPFSVGTSNFNSVLGAIETDYDLSGGTAYELELAEDNTEPVENVNDVIDTLKFRLNALGYENFSVKAVRPAGEEFADYTIRIEVKAATNAYGEPDLTSLDADVQTAAKYGELEFFGGSASDPSDKILEGKKVISGVSDSSYKDENGSLKYYVSITFTDEAYKYISDKMGEGSFYFKVTLGGETLSPFDGKTALSTNSFGQTVMVTTGSEAAAKQMALQISSGGLKYKYDTPVRIGAVNSPLGENAKMFAFIALGALVVAAAVALIIAYKGFGLVSALSMVLFAVIELSMLIAVPGSKLCMGGVIGMAAAALLTVDGFVITARRIKEEFTGGKTVKAAMKAGFKRSLVPVINSAVISAVVSVLLILFTKGQIKGFVITFGIGAVVSAICTLVFTRMFASLFMGAVSDKEAFFSLKRKEA